jgi:hypothetical protein
VCVCERWGGRGHGGASGGNMGARWGGIDNATSGGPVAWVVRQPQLPSVSPQDLGIAALACSCNPWAGRLRSP